MEEPKLNWYALKVFYSKVFDMEDRLLGIPVDDVYIPVRRVPLKGAEYGRIKKRLATPDDRRRLRVPLFAYVQEGPLIYKRECIVPSLLFVRCTPDQINSIFSSIINKEFPSAMIYRNAERDGFATVSERDIKMFRMVVGSDDKGLTFYSGDSIEGFRVGEKVRELYGPLKGVEGYIKRIKRDRRLLVSIEGFVAVATSFIPPEFLEVVQE